jgi:hypothetical protein
MTDMLEPPADRIEAAAEALQFDETEEEAPKETPEKDETEEKTEAKEEEEGEGSEEEESGESVSKDVEGDEQRGQDDTREDSVSESDPEEPPNWRWQQLRKRERQLKEYEDRIDARMTEFEQRAARIAKMERLLNEDPEGFASEVGDPDAVYDKWTNRRLNDGKPSEEELWSEIQGLKKQLRDREEFEKQRALEFQEQSKQAQVEKGIQSYVHRSDEIPESEELTSQFPALAITVPERRRSMVGGAVRWAISNAPEMTFNEILTHLDNRLKEEYDYIDNLRSSRDTGAQKKSPEAKGAAKPAAKRKKTVTNRDEAATSVDFKPLTRDQRIAAAARELPDFLPGKK